MELLTSARASRSCRLQAVLDHLTEFLRGLGTFLGVFLRALAGFLSLPAVVVMPAMMLMATFGMTTGTRSL
ncbi:MAG: hypothetical protein CMO74_09700 [Verrucomicrobiales bacterium]|nr:hypothetical protein [Verrucomicrobiales bacterium]